MKNIFKFLAILVVFWGFVSCSKDDPAPLYAPNPNVTFLATLNSANEVPTNTSTATGSATLVYNTITKIFTINVTHNVTSPTNGHIHKAAVGVNGSPVFPFTAYTSPMSLTSAPLDATQEADLYANLYYVNIHSTTFGGGEIRGQLIKQTGTGGGY
ncbi:CHRD domain-containing protein [Flavobacterium sp.]|uniref:CHRD domain-containing protein n=1 Tax=Flavobacterium sp. TaxID=239 RepID=UPI00286D8C61|nr:CHRD domain-containing protein [Flavobacterium sp.]